jgi:hypothetical protein
MPSSTGPLVIAAVAVGDGSANAVVVEVKKVGTA